MLHRSPAVSRGRAAGLSVAAAALVLVAGLAAAPAPEAPAPEAPALRAVADPEGGLRAATAEELGALADRISPQLRQDPGEVAVRVHPGGMRSAVVPQSYYGLSVAKVGADGRVVHECVTSEAEARAFFSPAGRDERGLELQ